jgi:hypothetical protein
MGKYASFSLCSKGEKVTKGTKLLSSSISGNKAAATRYQENKLSYVNMQVRKQRQQGSLSFF